MHDSAVTSDTSNDATIDDSTNADTAIPDDTNPTVDAFPEINPDTGNTCDLDGDGFESNATGCGHGPLDCNDYTPQANPSVRDFVFLDPVDPAHPDVATHWSGGPPGDWNCDGHVDKKYPDTTGCTGSGAACTGSSGIEGGPNCGKAGTIITCVTDLVIGCKQQDSKPANQGCM